MQGDGITRAGVDDASTGQPSTVDIRVALTRGQRRALKRLQRRNLRIVEREVIREDGSLPRE